MPHACSVGIVSKTRRMEKVKILAYVCSKVRFSKLKVSNLGEQTVDTRVRKQKNITKQASRLPNIQSVFGTFEAFVHKAMIKRIQIGYILRQKIGK